MPQTAKLTLCALLSVGTLICVGYIAAQQSPESKSAPSNRPQSSQTPPLQQEKQVGDQVAQLQMQVQDLQAAIDDLRSKQLVISATAEEAHQLASDSRVVRAQDRDDLNSLLKSANEDEKQLHTLGQQVSRIVSDLDRVKRKVGLY
jgi:uncharacterized protein YlxW (UPF0749 family)